mmetsp:Transcript_29830/g.48176  ORF Transcript_29830/g.48176 Transcript_29830/m.48176 type:complete len:336 (-) Transcript_29830:77-1084(-)
MGSTVSLVTSAFQGTTHNKEPPPPPPEKQKLLPEAVDLTLKVAAEAIRTRGIESGRRVLSNGAEIARLAAQVPRVIGQFRAVNDSLSTAFGSSRGGFAFFGCMAAHLWLRHMFRQELEVYQRLTPDGDDLLFTDIRNLIKSAEYTLDAADSELLQATAPAGSQIDEFAVATLAVRVGALHRQAQVKLSAARGLLEQELRSFANGSNAAKRALVAHILTALGIVISGVVGAVASLGTGIGPVAIGVGTALMLGVTLKEAWDVNNVRVACNKAIEHLHAFDGSIAAAERRCMDAMAELTAYVHGMGSIDPSQMGGPVIPTNELETFVLDTYKMATAP